MANRFTHHPDLADGLLTGAAQLLSWAIWRPAAWRRFLARAAPNLPQQFGLIELDGADWRNPAVRALLARMGVGAAVCAAVLAALAYQGGLFLWLAALCGSVALLAAAHLSVLHGYLLLVVQTALILLYRFFNPFRAYEATLQGCDSVYPVVLILALTTVGVFLVSVIEFPRAPHTKRLRWWLMLFLFVVLVGGIRAVAYLPTLLYELIGRGYLDLFTRVLAAVLNTALLWAFVFGVLGRGYFKHTRRHVLLGVALGVLGAPLLFEPPLPSSYCVPSDLHPAVAVLRDAFSSTRILFPVLAFFYWLMQLLPPRAVLALGLAVSGAVLGSQVLLVNTPLAPIQIGVSFAILLITAVAMFTAPRWGLVVADRLARLWNGALIRWGDPASWHRHSLFWFEQQPLPDAAVRAHVLRILDADRVAGEQAIAYLHGDARRQTALRDVQIELDARDLEARRTIELVRAAHHRLVASGSAAGPIGGVLRDLQRVSADVDATLNMATPYHRRLGLATAEAHLDGLLRDLARSAQPIGLRFVPIIEQWREIIGARRAELEEEARNQGEIESPYVVGVPLTVEQAIFVGRGDVSAQIERLLLGHPAPLLLTGRRRMGKTSLLRHLPRLLSGQFVPFFIDLQGAPTLVDDDAGFLCALAERMTAEALQTADCALPPITAEEFQTNGYARFLSWLDDVGQALGSRQAILLFDELEALDEALAVGRFNAAQLQGMLRHIIQHKPQFRLLFATTHTLRELTRWSGHLINAQVVHLSYLDAAAARRLVEQPVPDFALRYTPDATTRVLALTRCHPFLLQLLCDQIVQIKNRQPQPQRSVATPADVEAAVAPALQSGSLFFVQTEQDGLDAEAVAMLRLLAQIGPDDGLPAAELSERLGRDAQPALEQALRRDLIEPTPTGYRFQVELLRRWFAD